MNDRWLSVDEIGEYLDVKRDTVYKWIDALPERINSSNADQSTQK